MQCRLLYRNKIIQIALLLIRAAIFGTSIYMLRRQKNIDESISNTLGRSIPC